MFSKNKKTTPKPKKKVTFKNKTKSQASITSNKPISYLPIPKEKKKT
jgi:hypothetical protein